MVIQLIGLSGAGKSTIGVALYQLWKSDELNTVLVDGDEVRRIFAQDRSPTDYAVQGRRINAERIFEICSWLDRQGINVVCSTLSIFPDLQEMGRKQFSNYFEVFVDVPLQILQSRDVKNIYGPALAGKTSNVVGVDIPFPRPAIPDVVIENKFDTEPSHWAKLILSRAREQQVGRL